MHGLLWVNTVSLNGVNSMLIITKTRLYNFDPLKPHFYIVKLGFTGVYIIFLISAQNIDCGYLLEPPRRGGSNEYHNLCFEQKYEKISEFLSEDFHFLVVKFSVYLNSHVFVMCVSHVLLLLAMQTSLAKVCLFLYCYRSFNIVFMLPNILHLPYCAFYICQKVVFFAWRCTQKR